MVMEKRNLLFHSSNKFLQGVLIMKRLVDFWDDVTNSIDIPDGTTIGIMLIFPIIEICTFSYVGKPLKTDIALYTLLVTLIPFILGYKISNKIFENNEVLILVPIIAFVIFSGISLKSDSPSFIFIPAWYILAIIGCIIWTIIDFNQFNTRRTKRKEFSRIKNKPQENSNNSFDGMEVD
jgi:hypothetical protein